MSEYVTRVNEEKKAAVAYLKDKFTNVNDYIFADYRGLTVDQITELRKQLNQNAAEFRVIKNRFAKIAFWQLGYESFDEYLVGPTAVALSSGDTSAVVKQMYAVAKEWPIAIKGGLVEGAVYDAAQMEEFSKLPTRTELLGKLVGTMQAPVQNLAAALNDIPSRLVRTLQAVADQKKN